MIEVEVDTNLLNKYNVCLEGINMKSLNIALALIVMIIFLLSNAFGALAGQAEDAQQIQKLIDEKWAKGLNEKNLELFMSIWADDPTIQIVHFNDKGQVQLFAGQKAIKNVMASFMNQRNVNEFSYSHLTLQIDGDKASGMIKWSWGEWVDVLKTGKGNWGVGLFVKQQEQWKLHAADFYSVHFKMFSAADVEAIQKGMALVVKAYSQKDIAPLAQVAAVEHQYIDRHGRKHEGIQATQAALAKEFPVVELEAAKMTTYIYLRDGMAVVSQPRLQAPSPIQFSWKRQNGGWKLIETNMGETLAVQSQQKLLTAWGKVKRW